MKQLSLQGTAVEISGSGPPVVLLHGVGLNQSIWAGQVKALAADFQVITYDLLGHGRSAAARQTPRLPIGSINSTVLFAIWRWKNLRWWDFHLAD